MLPIPCRRGSGVLPVPGTGSAAAAAGGTRAPACTGSSRLRWAREALPRVGRVRTPSRQTGGTQNPQLGQDGRAVQNTWNKNLAQNLWDILGQQEMRTIRMYT